MKTLHLVGEYILLMRRVFSKPLKMSYFRKQLVENISALGLDSLLIVAIISIFMGAVLTIQTTLQTESPWIPAWTVGFVVRQSVVLEFSPTIVSLFLAGKIGSSIASEIGTMKVTEQIDALETMGINSASHLILPKIVACALANPVLVVISMFLALAGGFMVCVFTTAVPPLQYIDGLTSFFKTFDIYYALFKTFVFAIIISSISGFYGYRTEGGALEVGKASTQAVVGSSVILLLFNVILTKIFLG
ncbi:MAG: ABC transporter permease [Bacteroidales bacterium]|jgi:phospholipid/cholesterol/gamma-HCH transport system permease protein|nr:ABC transporter permease [Bacteroidales bacterium]